MENQKTREKETDALETKEGFRLKRRENKKNDR